MSLTGDSEDEKVLNVLSVICVYLLCQRMTDGRVSLDGDGEGDEDLNVLSVLCIPGMSEDDRRPCVSRW